jgi:putative membrane protein
VIRADSRFSERGVSNSKRDERFVARGTMGAVRDRVALSLIGVSSVLVVLLIAVLLLGHAPGRGGRADASALPPLNALLNGASAVLLVAGWTFVRRRRIAAHRACMLAAFCVSVLFLVSYVTYHALTGSRPFAATGWIRWVYFPILVTHIVLAAAMVPFVLTTLYRALGREFASHARLARVTLPVWVYVSVTGVVVYVMLYHLP